MWWNDLDRMDGRAIAIGAFFTFVPALAMLWQARRAARQDLLRDWSGSHYLVVPAEHRDEVAGHLRRMVWVRGIGAAAGWLVGGLLPIPAGPWGGVLLGYIVSAIVGELTAQRRLGVGVASLSSRRLEAYVPPAALLASRIFIGAALVLAVLPLVVERHPTFELDVVSIAATAIGIAVVGIGGVWSSRRVVARRQTAGTPELLAVDDALRSTSAHLLVASVLGAQLLGLTALAARVSSTVAPDALRWAGYLLAMCSFIAAVATLHLLSGRPWRVRREVVGTPA